MKEVKNDIEGMPYIAIRPTCDTCLKRKSRIDMVLNGCSATVDYCKEGLDIAFPKPCNSYRKNLRTRILELINLL